ncbi:MAG: TM0106 family RecB-like putative nuclease [Alcaligenaceae bacterium]|nr:TM0106 family RecB-like putative nuclease [Alcaligenaceae bacterium]
MYYDNSRLVFSPSDVVQFVDSPFASWMERLVLVNPDQVAQADADDSFMSMLQDKGASHEKALLETFKAQGKSIAMIDEKEDKKKATLEAIEVGVEVIFQAYLTGENFVGYADFLVKVDGASELGNYHYEVWDTKLSKELKPAFTIQLCCYQDLLARIQGVRSEHFVVVLGDGRKERLRTDDYYYYYQSVRDDFLQFHKQFDSNQRPDPAESTSWGRWGEYADTLLIEADHLLQVATITRSQIKHLQAAGITTMTALAQTKCEHVPHLNPVVFARLVRQAQLQIASVGSEKPLFEVLPIEPNKKQGLAMLPPDSALDVFFDIEGFPLVEGGLEYLWGCTYFDESGKRQFKDFWAHNEAEEKQAFMAFIHWVYERWQQDSTMHIYHYASYEITACRKLMGRYGVCEEEVDQLLRNEVFVDLYKVVRQGVLIGEPSYSIKNVEHIYRDARSTDVTGGADSVVAYENWRQQPDGDTWQTSEILNNLRAYNIDDCDSTQELTEWLRNQQAQHEIAYLGREERVEPEISEELTAKIELRDHLLNAAQKTKEADPKAATLQENLAWYLEFHRREAKPVFWTLFDRLAMTAEELFDDAECLALGKRTGKAAFKPTPRARNLVYEYSFDTSQDIKGVPASSYYISGEVDEAGNSLKVNFMKDHSDLAAGIVALQAKEEPPAQISLIPDSYVRPQPIPEAIEAAVRELSDTENIAPCAILDFLQRDYPRIKGHKAGDPITSATDAATRLTQIIHAISQLDNSYLAIQGPPGAGKTYTAKHVIADLVRQGKRVAISSNSHKAINNLLIGAAQYCQEQHITAYFACAKDTDPVIADLGIEIIKNAEIRNHTHQPCVIGTTAWGFAREDVVRQFDYLFIDEAGQVAVANLLAMSRAASNLVLMGDQMQLGQPTQGTHPGDSGLSILDYLLHQTPTISEEKGVFLDTTYRMHSAVNQFISQAVYEGKLHTDPQNDQQTVTVPTDYHSQLAQEAGIVYLPVDHEGNTQASTEEVALIQKTAYELLGRDFTAKDGSTRPISWDDMLFVAPYNQQVGLLQSALGEQAKVGSVDKFQGQEAPIVFFSLCASNASDSPRGMEFLFDKNRINVAISRAQSLAIVVANPALGSGGANNLDQQQKLNLFCYLVRYAENFKKVELLQVNL